MTGIISLLRKLRSNWLQGGIYLLALSVSYILLVNGIYYEDGSLILFSLSITMALHLGEQPMISKNEIKLHIVFGASNYTIWPLIIGQSLVKVLVISLLSLALSGVSLIHNMLPINSLFSTSNIWIIPLVIGLFLLLLSLLHFRLFINTKASVSMKQ